MARKLKEEQQEIEPKVKSEICFKERLPKEKKEKARRKKQEAEVSWEERRTNSRGEHTLRHRAEDRKTLPGFSWMFWGLCCSGIYQLKNCFQI